MNHAPLNAIDLSARPEVAAAARATHGQKGRVTVERYCLPRLWCLHLYNYQARLWVDGHEYSLRPRVATVIPPGAPIEYHFSGLSPHYYVHFALPENSGETVRIPVLFHLDAEADFFENELSRLAAADAKTLRAQIRLWELLWKLAESAQVTRTARHPSLEKVLSLIELHLGEALSIRALAREAGVSHNHLTRLFHAEFQMTAVAYVRKRRAERARHLLKNSSMPIKAVSRQVGVPDLRQFNALMKRETGFSPRALRSERSNSEDAE